MKMSNYFTEDRVSQSRLKKILIHPKAFQHNEYKDEVIPKETLLIGNAVDCLLTESHKFHSKFMIKDCPTLTGQYKDFVEELFKTRGKLEDEDVCWTKDDWYTHCFRAVTPAKTTSKLENFVAEFENNTEYYDYLVESQTISILSSKQYETIQRICDSLKTNPFTKDYFDKEDTQEEIYWEYKDVPMKSKLDKVIREGNRIYPMDLKTTESVGKFYDVFNRMNYKFQAVTYTLALRHKYPDCIIIPFRFVVEGVKYQGTPLVFEVSQETFEKGLEEFDLAIEKYKWHTENDLWDYTMEQYKNSGIVYI